MEICFLGLDILCKSVIIRVAKAQPDELLHLCVELRRLFFCFFRHILYEQKHFFGLVIWGMCRVAVMTAKIFTEGIKI